MSFSFPLRGDSVLKPPGAKQKNASADYSFDSYTNLIIPCSTADGPNFINDLNPRRNNLKHVI
jgi:hypothetical protein